MRARRWIAAASFGFVALLVGGAALAAVLNPPKSFSLPRVAVEAELAPDGSMRVVEHLTYDFTGDFTYGTRPIPRGAYEIRDVSVRERGLPLEFVNAPYDLMWFFAAHDEQRTFDIEYTVAPAATVGADVAELYWKWVGETHPTIDRVTVALAVPPGPGRILAWGHGPLNGTVQVEDDRVRWRADDVPQGTFVEGRVAMPSARFPGAVPGPGMRLPTIRSEETVWAEAANVRRRDAATSARVEHNARNLARFVAPFLTVLAAAAFLLIWLRWGREPRTPDDIGEYVRDLPDDPPAVVDALMHWGAVRADAFSATVLDLAQRGYLRVTETREDRAFLPDRLEYHFARSDKTEEDALPFERAALAQLFAAGPEVTQAEVVRFARDHQSDATERWNRFRKDVATDLRSRKYLHGGRAAPFVLNVAIAVLLGLVGMGALAVRAWIPGTLAVTWAVVQLALTPLLRQRSAAGQRRYHEWLGVRHYLHDFSQLADAPAGHLVLWERYLVYAVALGVSEELAAGLAIHLPAEQATQFAPWYAGAHPGIPSYGSIGGFSTTFGTAAVGSFTPASSGSGGGGGFSGGGGGGGGGGGIGAG